MRKTALVLLLVLVCATAVEAQSVVEAGRVRLVFTLPSGWTSTSYNRWSAGPDAQLQFTLMGAPQGDLPAHLRRTLDSRHLQGMTITRAGTAEGDAWVVAARDTAGPIQALYLPIMQGMGCWEFHGKESLTTDGLQAILKTVKVVARSSTSPTPSVATRPAAVADEAVSPGLVRFYALVALPAGLGALFGCLSKRENRAEGAALGAAALVALVGMVATGVAVVHYTATPITPGGIFSGSVPPIVVGFVIALIGFTITGISAGLGAFGAHVGARAGAAVSALLAAVCPVLGWTMVWYMLQNR